MLDGDVDRQTSLLANVETMVKLQAEISPAADFPDALMAAAALYLDYFCAKQYDNLSEDARKAVEDGYKKAEILIEIYVRQVNPDTRTEVGSIIMPYTEDFEI